MHAAGAFMIDQMGTQLVEEPQMRAFGNVVVIHRA